MVRLFALLMFVSFIAACTTQEVSTTEHSPLSKINALTVSSKKLVLNQQTKFAWEGPIVLKGNEAEKYHDRVPAVAQAIEAKFAKEGFQFSLLSAQTDYRLVAYVLLEGHEQLQDGTESKEHKELLFGLDPGMRASGNYGVGTLLVGIKDAKTDELMWRGAVQILTSSDLTEEQRKARLQNVINVLFKSALSQQ